MRMIVLGGIVHVCTISWLMHTHTHSCCFISFITVMRKLREIAYFYNCVLIKTSLLMLDSV